jgi:hypothetical protein
LKRTCIKIDDNWICPLVLPLAIRNSPKQQFAHLMGAIAAGPVLLYSPRFHSSATVALALIDVN